MRGVELILGEARTAVPLRRPLPRGGSNSSRVWAGGGAAVWAAVSHLGCKRVRLPRMPLQPNALTWARALTQILTRHGALQYCNTPRRRRRSVVYIVQELPGRAASDHAAPL